MQSPLYCHYHQYVHHKSKDCRALCRMFHKKITDGTLDLTQEQEGQWNPLRHCHSTIERRLSQWLLQLSEFEIILIAPIAVKGQAIDGLLVWFPGEESWNITNDVPSDLPEVSMVEEIGGGWVLRFDGSLIATEGGAGIVLAKKTREIVAMYFKLDFPCIKNTIEYVAYLRGLAVALEMRIKHL